MQLKSSVMFFHLVSLNSWLIFGRLRSGSPSPASLPNAFDRDFPFVYKKPLSSTLFLARANRSALLVSIEGVLRQMVAAASLIAEWYLEIGSFLKILACSQISVASILGSDCSVS